jgi:hypothetical protein
MTSAPRAEPPERLEVFSERIRDSVVADRRSVVERARRLFEDVCVHLPERQLRGLDPLPRLRALVGAARLDVPAFYRELLGIFATFGDRHTRCFLPEPWASRIAFLPFVVVEVHEHGRARIALRSSADPALSVEDEITRWNHEPIDEVMERLALEHYGAHAEARRAQTVALLTARPLAFLPLPDERAVVVEGRKRNGVCFRAEVLWQVGTADTVRASQGESGGGHGNVRGRAPAVELGLEARTVTTRYGEFGYLALRSLHAAPEVLLAAVIEELERLPDSGLILDLRGCENGVVMSGEELLQLFTDRPIEPLLFQFRVTDFTRRLVKQGKSLTAWQDTMTGLASGDVSRALPLTSRAAANSRGRVYRGPTLLLTDALTYSTAEMFADGFRRHEIGPILGAASRTGGGGGSAWSQQLLHQISGDVGFRAAPNEPTFRVAVRRATRTGAAPVIEGCGVPVDIFHRATRDDHFAADRSLLEVATHTLNARRRTASVERALSRATNGLVCRTFGENSDEQSRRVGGVSSEFTSEEGGGACRPHKQAGTPSSQTDRRSRETRRSS